MFVIVVDASTEDCVKSMRAWLQLIKQHACPLLPQTQAKDVGTDQPPAPVQPPLVVVASKGDQIRVETIESLKKAKTVQGQLRALCLQGESSPGRQQRNHTYYYFILL